MCVIYIMWLCCWVVSCTNSGSDISQLIQLETEEEVSYYKYFLEDFEHVQKSIESLIEQTTSNIDG